MQNWNYPNYLNSKKLKIWKWTVVSLTITLIILIIAMIVVVIELGQTELLTNKSVSYLSGFTFLNFLVLCIAIFVYRKVKKETKKYG